MGLRSGEFPSYSITFYLYILKIVFTVVDEWAGLSMGHICLSHPIAIYACRILRIPIIILIWKTIQLNLLNL